MEIFADTADTAAIAPLARDRLIDGVTTNPTLIARSGRDMREVIAEICKLVSGPVSAEVSMPDCDGMQREAEALIGIAPNVCIKLPLTRDGLRACRALADRGCQTNVTLCFTVPQALLAAKAGATYVSPFVGRLDDTGTDGTVLIRKIVATFRNYPALRTRVLAASLRTVHHVAAVAEAGAHAATIPPKVVEALLAHPQTDQGLQTFAADWKTSGQSIL